MKAMITFVKKLAADESGATAIDYGLIAAHEPAAAIAALQAMGGSLVAIFEVVKRQVRNAANGATTTP